MFRIGFLSSLVIFALTVWSASSAEAQKSRSWQYEGPGSGRFIPYDRRSARREGRKSRSERDRGSPTTDGRSPAAAEVTEPTKPAAMSRAFSAVIERLVRACVQQASLFQSWPFEDIVRITAPDDAQRGTLDTLRATTKSAAEKLSANCPQELPEPAWGRLEAVEQSVDAVDAALAAVEPPLQSFYAALDDEQKARLLRDLTLAKGQTRMDERGTEPRDQRSRQQSSANTDRGTQGKPWASICENLITALRGWQTTEIERSVGLSDAQRVAFYEFVTFSLRAAETLTGACPAETALTPVGRMKVLRARLAAVRHATTAIHPTLGRFYQALDEGQRVRFATMQ